MRNAMLLMPALTGLLLFASFPRAGQGYLAWIAFVPLIVFIFRCKSPARAFGGGFIAGAIELFTLLIWIPPVLTHYGDLSVPLAWVGYLLLISVLACFPAAACAFAKLLVRRGGDSFLLLFPAVWIVFEYAQNFFPFGGLPWLLTGYSQAGYLPLIQIADVTGIYGISFLILGFNTAIAWTFLHRGKSPAGFWPLIAAGSLVAVCLVYGGISLHRWGHLRAECRAAMLQGNISIDEPEWVQIDKSKKGYKQMADSLKPSNIDLLILPESPSPVTFQYDRDYRQMLEDLAGRYPLGLIFNNNDSREVKGETRYFNSACYLDRSGKLSATYDKIHLVPFGEYIPLKKFFFFSQTISKDVEGFYPGSDFRIMQIGGHPSNAIICFEAVFPSLVRRFAGKGSQLIVNLTNDGWYGVSSAPYQHLAIARMRAIENRRYLLRATNSGISAIIEPTGRIQTSTGLLQEAICEGRFGFVSVKTPYTRYGDVFVLLCAIISCGALVPGRSVSRRQGSSERVVPRS